MKSDFVPRCPRCLGFGHEESACPSDATIPVTELPDNDSEEEKREMDKSGYTHPFFRQNQGVIKCRLRLRL